MTAKVTSSASDSLGAIPTAGRQGARCGEVFSRSSVVTYSAVARVSRAASTGPPRLDVGFATPILDALLHLRIWLLGGRKLRPLGIGHLGSRQGRGQRRAEYPRALERCSTGRRTRRPAPDARLEWTPSTTVKTPPTELAARLRELTLADQQRLRRRLDRARKLRGAEARQAAVAEIATEVDAAERRVARRRAAVPKVSYRRHCRSRASGTRSWRRCATTRS